jgi:hypothetical protein
MTAVSSTKITPGGTIVHKPLGISLKAKRNPTAGSEKLKIKALEPVKQAAVSPTQTPNSNVQVAVVTQATSQRLCFSVKTDFNTPCSIKVTPFRKTVSYPVELGKGLGSSGNVAPQETIVRSSSLYSAVFNEPTGIDIALPNDVVMVYLDIIVKGNLEPMSFLYPPFFAKNIVVLNQRPKHSNALFAVSAVQHMSLRGIEKIEKAGSSEIRLDIQSDKSSARDVGDQKSNSN